MNIDCINEGPPFFDYTSGTKWFMLTASETDETRPGRFGPKHPRRNAVESGVSGWK